MSVIVTARDFADQRCRRHRPAPAADRASGRRSGRAAGRAFRTAPRSVRPTQLRLNAACCGRSRACSRCSRSDFTSSSTWSSMLGAGRAGARRIFEREGAGIADLVDQRSVSAKSASVSPGKPTMKSDVKRDVGPRRAQPRDDVEIIGAACAGGSSRRACGRSPTAPADAVAASAPARSRWAAIRSSSMSRGWLVV